MSPTLSKGYSVSRHVLSPADLSGLREAISETIDRTAHALRTPFEESAPDAPFDQRLGPLPHVTNGAGQFHVPEEHLPLEARRAVPLLVGDVLVLDRFVPHRSLPVRAGHMRWAIVTWVKAVAYEGEG